MSDNTRFYCVDRADGTLDSQLLSSATSGTFTLTLVNSLGTQSFNATANYKIIVTIEDEQILCSAMSVSGSTVTLTIQTRGYNNTTAATHASATTVSFNIVAKFIQQLSEDIYTVDQQFRKGLVKLNVDPTITNATTLSFASVDYSTTLGIGQTILIKISSTWYRCTIKALSFSTNTTVTVTSDTLPSSGTVADWGVEMYPSAFVPIEYTKFKEVANVPATPATGYAYEYLKANGKFLKDDAGLIRFLSKVNGTASSSSGVLTLDALAANVYDTTLTENVTSLSITGGTSLGDGEILILRIKQHASSAKTVALGTGSTRFGVSIASFTMSTTTGVVDILTFCWNTTAGKWDLAAVLQGQA